jgi:hypothetical protein
MFNSFLNCWPEVQILSGTPFGFNGLEHGSLQIILFLRDFATKSLSSTDRRNPPFSELGRFGLWRGCGKLPVDQTGR